jgi:hypothetical protein
MGVPQECRRHAHQALKQHQRLASLQASLRSAT